MNNILFLAHTDSQGALPKAALETLSAAAELAEALSVELNAGLFGADAAKAAAQSAGAGADSVFTVTGGDFAEPRYASDAAAATALMEKAGGELVLAPDTSRMARALPGAAARTGGAIDTHVTALAAKDGGVEATRWYYRQRMFGSISRAKAPWVLTLSPGCAKPFAGEDGAANIIEVEVSLPDSAKRTKVLEIQAPSADQQTIRPDAELLFVAGAGWTKKQADGQPHLDNAASLILDFLGESKASLGSSKSLVDISGEGQKALPFLTHLHQVGQTGATPRHPKGLATCCHGEEPHVVGWRFINERRAINLDAGCGWAQGKADVLYVADAFEVMNLVNKMLSE